MKYEIDGYVVELKRYEDMGVRNDDDKGYDRNYDKLK